MDNIDFPMTPLLKRQYTCDKHEYALHLIENTLTKPQDGPIHLDGNIYICYHTDNEYCIMRDDNIMVLKWNTNTFVLNDIDTTYDDTINKLLKFKDSTKPKTYEMVFTTSSNIEYHLPGDLHILLIGLTGSLLAHGHGSNDIEFIIKKNNHVSLLNWDSRHSFSLSKYHLL
jgi:hypothetical protein